MKRFICIIASAIAAFGCTEPVMNDFLLDISGISLTWKGVPQVEYTPENYQLGYSSNNEYRVYDDNLADWFIVKCSEKPSDVGQTLTADVSWTGEKSTKDFTDLQFSVEKTDGNGLVWMWNNSNRIGIVIKNL